MSHPDPNLYVPSRSGRRHHCRRHLPFPFFSQATDEIVVSSSAPRAWPRPRTQSTYVQLVSCDPAIRCERHEVLLLWRPPSTGFLQVLKLLSSLSCALPSSFRDISLPEHVFPPPNSLSPISRSIAGFSLSHVLAPNHGLRERWGIGDWPYSPFHSCGVSPGVSFLVSAESAKRRLLRMREEAIPGGCGCAAG